MSTTATTTSSTNRIVLDYTSRDYKAIRSMLVGLAKGLLPEWQTVGETGDFGTLLLELYAYAGDVTNYYIDRVSSEAFLGTAIRRQSVMYIADMFGYTPIGQRAATVPLSFTWRWDTAKLPGNAIPVYTYDVNSASVANGVVTMNISNDDYRVNMIVGQTVTISGVGVPYDGIFVVDSVISPADTTAVDITYSVVSTASGTASISGGPTLTTGSVVIIPAGTYVTTSPDSTGNVIVFELNFDVTLDTVGSKPIKDGSTIYSVSQLTAASEGASIDPTLAGVSKGIPNSEFVLANPGVIDRTVQVYTKEAGQVVQWSRVDKISLATPTQSVFTTYVDDQNYTHILFGDNASGRVPPTNVEIYVSYRYGSGVSANSLGVNTITVLNNDYATQNGITVTNTASPVGGADVESIESMRYSIPRASALKQRAVTIEDYVNLALQVPGVTKATAYGENYTAVYVRVASSSESVGYTTSNALIRYVNAGVATVAISGSLSLSVGQTVYATGIGTNLNGSVKTTKVFYTGSPVTVLNKSLTTSTAKIRIASVGNFVVGQPITVSISDTIFDGTKIISAIESVAVSGITYYDLSYAKTVSAAVSNKALTTNVATLTTSAAHGFQTGWQVVVTGVDATFNGTYTITGTPTTTSFTYAKTATNVTSTAVSPTGLANINIPSAAVTSGTVTGAAGITYATSSSNILEAQTTTGTITTTSSEMQLLINSLESYLSDKKLIGSVVYGEPVEWTNVDVSINVQVRPLYNRESVRAAVQAAVEKVFSYDNVDFGKRISIGDVYRSALAVDGVDYITLNTLKVVDATGPIEDINTPEYNLPRIAPTITSIYPAGWVIANGGLVNT